MRTIYRAIARCSERATTTNIACWPASQIETRSAVYEKRIAGGCGGFILHFSCACADRCTDRDRQGADGRTFHEILRVPAGDPGQAGQPYRYGTPVFPGLPGHCKDSIRG